MPLAEIVHVPTVVNHRRHHHFEQNVIVDDHVTHEKKEIVNVSRIIPQERVIQETVEQVLEVPAPMSRQKSWTCRRGSRPADLVNLAAWNVTMTV